VGVFGALRTAISITFIAAATWFAFSVDLGPRTLAEHVDRISETDEAQQLMEGARDRVNPALEDAKQRVLGEHIEAPTLDDEIDAALPAAGNDASSVPPRIRSEQLRTDSAPGLPRASDPGSTRLPGRR
jgi:hypothetical protein